jgi:hypothetical protein
MQEIRCGMHGVGLRFVTESPAIAEAVRGLLRHFVRESFAGPVALEFAFQVVASREAVPITLSPAARLLAAHDGLDTGGPHGVLWKCTAYQDEDRRILDFHQHGVLLIDRLRSRVDGYLVEPEAMHPHIRAGYFFAALAELLQQQGIYAIHAAALEKAGRGLLISGASGRGKTTSCIALLRDGYRCLSDDHPLLRVNGAGPELLSFPVKIDVTEKSIDFFPELRAARENLCWGIRKRHFFAEEFYPDATADTCEPAVILFPQVIEEPNSRLEPLSKSRALEELLREGNLPVDREVARRLFFALSRLVETTACYRLLFGEDVLALPQLVDSVMEQG